jgi:hypothetical protein
VRVQRIKTGAIVSRQVQHFGACGLQQVCELLMIVCGGFEIRRAGIAEITPFSFDVIPASKGVFGPFHDDAPEARHHALASE